MHTSAYWTAFERATLRCLRIVNGSQERRNPFHRSVRYTWDNTGDILLSGFHEQVFQIKERLFRCCHIHERRSYTCFPATPRTTNLMYVVLDLFGHAEDDDVLDIIEVEALGCDARSNHDIFGARLE
jgi:hypothetical protein